jgi:methylenetetrahydrofolate dehydrogenase (NADP+)/methenyltetrahydrofolate cyclohydrolase
MAGARVLEGRPIANRIRDDVFERAKALREVAIVPHCSTFVGEGDKEGAFYAESLRKVGTRLGVEVSVHVMSLADGTRGFVKAITDAARNHKIHGIIVQRPLPPSLDLYDINTAIPVEKDVDAASPLSLGWLAQGMPHFAPATAAAVIEMLREPGLIPIAGSRTVVIGRSPVVGRPVAYMLTSADATVTLCHSKTRDLEAICRSADILVAAIGKPRLVDAKMIKRGAVVVDVGTNLVDGQVVGDVDFESVSQLAGAITPVPGGVGVVTTSILLRNVVAAAEHGTI